MAASFRFAHLSRSLAESVLLETGHVGKHLISVLMALMRV